MNEDNKQHLPSHFEVRAWALAMPILTLDGTDQETQDRYADEVCDECGGLCSSSKECVEASGLYEDPP